MKFLLLFIISAVYLNRLDAQSVDDLINIFKSFEFGSNKVETEITSINLGLKLQKYTKIHEKEKYRDTVIQYSDLRYDTNFGNTEILMLFCNGKLYYKNIRKDYSRNEYNSSKELFKGLNSFMKENYPDIKPEYFTISNEKYGSDIGELVEYVYDFENVYMKVTVELKGKLGFTDQIPIDSNQLIITGWTLSFEVVNLSDTPLNPKDGYMTF